MVKVFVGTDKEYYLDGYLKQNLDLAKEVIAKDWDMVFLYDGPEGSGKSVKAIQDAYYCDPTLVLERVVFTPEEFKRAIGKAEKYQAVVYDEAYTGLSSRATMSTINRAIVSMLAEIRQKNLFVFIVMPCYFDLDKYVALWRSRALIHVYTSEKFQRGFFSFYNTDRKKDLYVFGKKFYNYSKPKPNFRARFTKAFPLDDKEYRARKLKALQDKTEKKDEYDNEFRAKMCNFILKYQEKIGKKYMLDKEWAEIFGVDRRTITNRKKSLGIKLKRKEERKLLLLQNGNR